MYWKTWVQMWFTAYYDYAFTKYFLLLSDYIKPTFFMLIVTVKCCNTSWGCSSEVNDELFSFFWRKFPFTQKTTKVEETNKEKKQTNKQTNKQNNRLIHCCLLGVLAFQMVWMHIWSCKLSGTSKNHVIKNIILRRCNRDILGRKKMQSTA